MSETYMLLTTHAFATLHCLHGVKTRLQTIAESFSSINLVGRDDIFQVSLFNLVKYCCKKGEKLYRRE